MKPLKSLSEQVYDYIIKQIKLNRLNPGDRLQEADLIEKLQISRTPLREALIQLTADGVIENIPRKGFFVRKYDEERGRDTWRVIAQLDAYAAVLAVDRITDAELNQMDSAIHMIDFAIDHQDYEIYNDQMETFHGIYLDACGNQRLIELINQLEKECVRIAAYPSDGKELFTVLAQSNDEHREILRYFREKDVEALRKTVASHWLIVQRHDKETPGDLADCQAK